MRILDSVLKARNYCPALVVDLRQFQTMNRGPVAHGPPAYYPHEISHKKAVL